MFHLTENSLKNRLLGVSLLCLSFITIPPENASGESVDSAIRHYNPENGFKPGQSSMSEIFLQLAGSLAFHESPMPYFRHVTAEHDRIAAKYRDVKGKEMASFLPSYMTDEYLDEMQASWDELAENLTLDELSKESGELLQLAIDGKNGKGTSLVLLFNWHQDRVFEDMASEGDRQVGFKQLKEELLKLAGEGDAEFLARRETELSEAEGVLFQSLIKKSKFSKSDFAALERFYDGPHDRLSDYGKALLSQRVFAGQRGENLPPSDAEKYSAEMLMKFETLFGKLREQLTPELSRKLIERISWMAREVTLMAQTEYELSIIEWGLE